MNKITVYIKPMTLFVSFVLLIGFTIYLIIVSEYDHYPAATNGELDTSFWDTEDGSIPLSGEWHFYWSSLLEPDERSGEEPVVIDVPRSWNGTLVNGETIGGKGYATYHVQVTAPEADDLALYMPYLLTAYRLWINGESVASNGEVGTSAETMTPRYFADVVPLASSRDQIDIHIQVSNFMHAEGGMNIPLRLGTHDTISSETDNRRLIDGIIFGSLLIMSIYHFLVFLLRPRFRSALYFSLFCLMIGIRSLLVGEAVMLRVFPDFNWTFAMKLEYVTTYLSPPLFILFLSALFPNETSRLFRRVSVTIGLILGSIVILFPVYWFTQTLIVGQVVTVITVGYICYILILAALRKRMGATVSLFMAFLYAITIVNDILYDYQLSIYGNLSPAGLLFFILAQSFMLASIFSKAFTDLEDMSERLIASNEILESKVEERTKKLKDLSVRDPLTNVYNRGGFDQQMKAKWTEALQERKELSLLFVDIDYFKRYNDEYGHQAGDQTLISVAHTLQEALGEKAIVSRYGGEEFVLILPGASEEQAASAAATLLKAIRDQQIPHSQSQVAPYVTVSIGGISRIPNETDKPDAFIKQADQALYAAKEAGRDRYILAQDV
ncbi:sensor domain-containing diguanylate cyclase [Salisediminibacterium selenitireducens]|uniref:7TM domain sensor diguanylate cyclase n=1 Tax=Bacillus selenitireducens (strain ATCC 700615 / DSM 15326 / MLS10) TaxID=439292 RepID=D6XY32_BACIE|nr:diguanylate cyclase [Salisediminibacterium selenitireducens]ADH98105.1 7TM domain sensor diguanylate cyclase [[Bacillus] selenitireducens MLS10]